MSLKLIFNKNKNTRIILFEYLFCDDRRRHVLLHLMCFYVISIRNWYKKKQIHKTSVYIIGAINIFFYYIKWDMGQLDALPFLKDR